MIRTFAARLAAAALAAAGALSPAHAQAPDRIVFATDWLAQAEHGGFYQALAEGIYRKHNLDVTIRMGGPQVNGLQLLAAGQIDVAMADGAWMALDERGRADLPFAALPASGGAGMSRLMPDGAILELEGE